MPLFVSQMTYRTTSYGIGISPVFLVSGRNVQKEKVGLEISESRVGPEDTPIGVVAGRVG